MTSTALAVKQNLQDKVDEYEERFLALPAEIKAFNDAGERLKNQAAIDGTFGNEHIDTGGNHDSLIYAHLLKSAWLNIFKLLNIDMVASAKDKKEFQQAMTSPPEFNYDNVIATFGDYILDPWANILRGLAEVFAGLDPFYKSHDNFRVGVKGLPKRIIITGVGGYGSYGRDKITDVLNALAAYQRIPLVSHAEVYAILKDGDALLKEHSITKNVGGKEVSEAFPARGIRLKHFQNGNAHMHFEPATLKDINRALADYYGEQVADCYEGKPDTKEQSTEVSKDLQFYPTPQKAISRLLYDVYHLEGKKVLEPSAGDGRMMQAIKNLQSENYNEKANSVEVVGYEFHAGRASECRSKGLDVQTANFLDVEPKAIFDYVIMNPPFYGKHYAKHVEHALKFLSTDGKLCAILPCTARYNHGLIDALRKPDGSKYYIRWEDLPVGSFRESGTNINTCIVTIS